jgi:hypothetical protein
MEYGSVLLIAVLVAVPVLVGVLGFRLGRHGQRRG